MMDDDEVRASNSCCAGCLAVPVFLFGLLVVLSFVNIIFR